MAVRFDHFMKAALYDESCGYYTSRIQSVGPRGDFATSATLSPLLAKAIAREITQYSSRLPVIELGPGTGELAQAVRKALPWPRRLSFRQYLVEISPQLRKSQKALNPKAVHTSTIEEALKLCGGIAFIYSNEFVDAFPVRVFRKEPDGYAELFLEGSAGAIRELWLASQPPHSSYLRHNWITGQRFEVHESHQQWLSHWRGQWHGPAMLTIDYGGSPKEVLARRPAGTLRAYFQQQRCEGASIYENPGHQDLTADVNFDDLRLWGANEGLIEQRYQTQAEFLTPFQKLGPSDRFITHSEGAGSAFKVLLQKANRRQSG